MGEHAGARVAEQRTHELKVPRRYWQALALELRTFEICRDDGFRPGDLLHLRECEMFADVWSTAMYTGRECWRQVDYVLAECNGLEAGFVALAIKRPPAPPDLRPNRMRPIAVDPADVQAVLVTETLKPGDEITIPADQSCCGDRTRCGDYNCSGPQTTDCCGDPGDCHC